MIEGHMALNLIHMAVIFNLQVGELAWELEINLRDLHFRSLCITFS